MVFTLAILILTVVFHLMQLNFKLVLQSILPISYSAYWFITDYFILYLISPFLNKMLLNFERKDYIWNLTILGLFAVIFPTFLRGSFEDASNSLVLFIFCYIVGAYIRNYKISNGDKRLGLILTTSSLVILWGILIFLNVLSIHLQSRFIYIRTFILDGQLSPFVFTCALGLFLWGRTWNLGSNKIINIVASTTLGIYLIHDNPIIENLLWIKWLHLPSLMNQSVFKMLMVMFVVCPLVFLICSLIEFARQKLFSYVNNMRSNL